MDSGKCSHRRLRPTIESSTLLTLVLLASAASAAQEPNDSVAREAGGVAGTTAVDQVHADEPSLAVLERFVAEVDTLTASFEQELWTDDQELLETVAGQFSLARPDRFYWHYETDPEQYVIADGKTLWMYDVELEQVTRAPLDELSSASPAMLLSGDAAVSESFELVDSFELDGGQWVELEPRVASGDFESVLIEFREDVPVVLEIVDGLNQTTRIEFSNVTLNAEVDEEIFEFRPPRGVSVIGGEP